MSKQPPQGGKGLPRTQNIGQRLKDMELPELQYLETSQHGSATQIGFLLSANLQGIHQVQTYLFRVSSGKCHIFHLDPALYFKFGIYKSYFGDICKFRDFSKSSTDPMNFCLLYGSCEGPKTPIFPLPWLHQPSMK